MTQPTIREALVDDADEVAAIHVRSWRAAYRGLIDQDTLDALSVSDRAENWRRIVAAPLPTSLGILVAVREGRTLGWTSFGSGRDDTLSITDLNDEDTEREHSDRTNSGSDSPDGEIYGIYADPDAWSTGIGHALLAAAEHRLTEAGHTHAYLWVLDGNDRADAFYARHGWRTDGARKVEERPGLTLSEHRRTKRLGAEDDGD